MDCVKFLSCVVLIPGLLYAYIIVHGSCGQGSISYRHRKSMNMVGLDYKEQNICSREMLGNAL